MKRHIYTFIIVAVLLLSASTVSAYAGEVSITTTNPQTGHRIETTLRKIDEQAIDYKWTVDNKEIDNDESYYIPTANDYESWIEVFAISKEDGSVVSSSKIFFSPLPVVYIDTGNVPVTSRDEYIKGDMFIQGNYQFESQYDKGIEIKGRGTSTWHYDKKPYKLKLDKKTNLFGFGKSKHYVLLANYLDPSLLRNTVAYQLSRALNLTATDTIWVDVIFNGEYAGNYQLAEHVRIGEQLVDITDWEDIAGDVAEGIAKKFPNKFKNEDDISDLEDYLSADLSWITSKEVLFNGNTYDLQGIYDIQSTNGGFLFQMDTGYEDEKSHFKTKGGIKIAVSKPEMLYTNPEMMQYAQEYLQEFENAIKSEDGYFGDVHYSELADFQSMLAYWLSMELLSNDDAGARSRYCYKPVDGLLVFGPVWDFDISSGGMRSFLGPIGWNPTGGIEGFVTQQDFFIDFVDDPYFQVKAQELYWDNRDFFKSLVADGGIIDTYVDLLYESATANEIKWTKDDYVARTFTGEYGDASEYKKFLKARLKWLDSVFKNENTTAKALKWTISNHSYVRSKRISLRICNANRDDSKHGASYLVDSETSPKLRVAIDGGKTAKIYVNGLYYETVNCKGRKTITIPSELLTEPHGKKNVITVISSYKGKSIKNHVSIRTEADQTVSDEQMLVDNCGHTSVDKINYREATNERYGLKESYYCNDCHHYFADEKCTEQLSPSKVIKSSKTTKHHIGLIIKLNRLLRKEVDNWPF